MPPTLNQIVQCGGNSYITLLPSAARTVATTSEDFANYGGRGMHVVVDVTAVTATPGLTVTIQGKDEVSGKYYTLLAGLAITTVSTTIYKIFPGSAVSANVSANDIIPHTFRVSVAVADADAATYSIGASLIK
jgi:hypothetical protein